MTRAPVAALLAALAAGPAGGQALDPEVVLDLFEGRTVGFATVPGGLPRPGAPAGEDPAAGGVPVGPETFLSRSRTLYRLSDGTCTPGLVSVRGGSVCFFYEEVDDEDCWRFVRVGLRLFLELTDPGEEAVQEVTALTDAPLRCVDVPVG